MGLESILSTPVPILQQKRTSFRDPVYGPPLPCFAVMTLCPSTQLWADFCSCHRQM